jgi:lantibiotic biosynthesis protein
VNAAAADATVEPPLLDGRLASIARRRLARIAADIGEAETADCSLGDGHAGMALFLADLAGMTGEAGHRRCAEWHLRRALAGTGRCERGGLFFGWGGVASALAELAGEMAASLVKQIADRELAYLLANHPRAPAGLMSGLAGQGVFFLHLRHQEIGQTGLAAVLDLLERRARVDTRSPACWHTASEQAWYPGMAKAFPGGFYELGYARGAAGIVTFLADAAGSTNERRWSSLAREAAQWLLTKQLPPSDEAVFPDLVAAPDEAPRRTSRPSWCGGDLGIALAATRWQELLGTAVATDLARRLALGVSRREGASAGLVDACLCHGTAGVAYGLLRLSQATGDRALREAALRWYEGLLCQDEVDGCLGGYRFYKGGWVSHPGLLSGAAGVGMALLGALSNEPLACDRALGWSAGTG